MSRIIPTRSTTFEVKRKVMFFGGVRSFLLEVVRVAFRVPSIEALVTRHAPLGRTRGDPRTGRHPPALPVGHSSQGKVAHNFLGCRTNRENARGASVALCDIFKCLLVVHGRGCSGFIGDSAIRPVSDTQATSHKNGAVRNAFSRGSERVFARFAFDFGAVRNGGVTFCAGIICNM